MSFKKKIAVYGAMCLYHEILRNMAMAILSENPEQEEKCCHELRVALMNFFSYATHVRNRKGRLSNRTVHHILLRETLTRDLREELENLKTENSMPPFVRTLRDLRGTASSMTKLVEPKLLMIVYMICKGDHNFCDSITPAWTRKRY